MEPACGAQLRAVEQACRHHPFAARFPVDLAAALIEEFGGTGGVYDPFLGSGTTAVAATLAQREVGGGDVDDVAGLLCRVKLAARPAGEAAAWRERLGRRLEKVAGEVEALRRPRLVVASEQVVTGLTLRMPHFTETPYWFPARGGLMLAAVAAAVARTRDPVRRDLGWAALSASVLSKWPTTLSYAMDVDHSRPHRVEQDLPPGRVVETFLRRLDRQIAAADALHRAYADAGALDYARRALGRVACPLDARQAWPVDDGSLSLVLTSPPYFNAVDYPRGHRLAVCWMQPWTRPDLNGTADAWLKTRRPYVGLRHAGGLVADDWYADRPAIRKAVPSAARHHVKWGGRLCGFFDDLSAVLARSHAALRPGGHAAFVIGDNVIGGARVPVGRVLGLLACEVGFRLVASRQRRIAWDRRRYPVGPFGFDGPMRHERVMVLRKE